jgi:hypothetical protein
METQHTQALEKQSAREMAVSASFPDVVLDLGSKFITLRSGPATRL